MTPDPAADPATPDGDAGAAFLDPARLAAPAVEEALTQLGACVALLAGHAESQRPDAEAS